MKLVFFPFIFPEKNPAIFSSLSLISIFLRLLKLVFLLTIPLQKLAYYSALKKGYDIDKPRNLAKWVTVE